MNKKKYAEIVVGLPAEGPFDYAIPFNISKQIKIGMRVKVPFGHRNLVGYVVGFREKAHVKKTKEIYSCLDTKPLISPKMLKLAHWISNYYFSSWGEAIEVVVPGVLKRRKFVE